MKMFTRVLTSSLARGQSPKVKQRTWQHLRCANLFLIRALNIFDGHFLDIVESIIIAGADLEL